ncbi:MAG: hypothetical protein NVSMB27_01350 [Ktedonobacteraceae bacterium]
MQRIRPTKTTERLFITDLVGCKIVTAEGKKIGHVVDIQVTRGPLHEVTALVFGRYAWLYRFDVLHPFAKTFGIQAEPQLVPWEAVERFERFVVTLKADYRIKH